MVAKWPSTFAVDHDIELIIARLDADGTPRNYGHQFEERGDVAGGHQMRLWVFQSCDGPDTVASSRGPVISYGGETDDYVRAAAGMKRVDKAIEKMRTVRGPSADAADALGRWLEACGVDTVFIRPEGSRNEGWLNKGDWDRVSCGSFVSRVRAAMPENAKPIANVA